MTLRSVEIALADVLVNITPLAVERVPLAQVSSRVLAEDISADSDLPAAPNSSMDGFAVRAEDVARASPESPVSLPVVIHIAAGSVAGRMLGHREAARIMTGAPLPPGADAIVPVEATDADWSVEAAIGETVQIHKASAAGAYVRPRGEDMRAGEVVLTCGRHLLGAEIGVLAALGVVEPLVYRQPRVAILSSGEELLSVDQPLAPGRIRESNSYALASLIAEHGGQPLRFPIARDDLGDIRATLWSVVAHAPDLIISSAGVSVGAADYVLAALREIGELQFWRVNMRPGKPLAFGRIQGIPFFGLPGNPVSALVTFDVFVRPTLLKMGGHSEDRWPQPVISVRAGEEFRSDGRRSYLRTRLEWRNGEWFAFSTGTQSSGAMMSLVRADGLLIIDAGVARVDAGSVLSLRPLRPLPHPTGGDA